MPFELIIDNGRQQFSPPVHGEILLETFEQGRCSKLVFSALSKLPVLEGDIVSLRVGGTPVFLGVVFAQAQASSLRTITAYDQLRYLRNRDTYVYHSKSASDVVRMIALDYKLKLGAVAQTSYIIPSRVEDNVSLANIIQNALNIEFEQTSQRFLLLDEFGRLSLKTYAQMQTNLSITPSSCESFDLSTSVDSRFNRVKVSRYDRRAGRRDIFVASDPVSESRLGILQHYSPVGLRNEVLLPEQAHSLLKVFNRDCRKLRIHSLCSGNIATLRAGSIVSLSLPDIAQRAVVSRCLHRISAKKHVADLEVSL
ncbi:MAG: hypothetical protein FWD35_01625 [Oscillospiraceae bacterium]|nr:hypothetical protein [Oscillospiraceae bacterium]